MNVRAIVLLGLFGCSQGPVSSGGDFQTTPMEMVTSDSGQLTGAVFLQQAQPLRGVNAMKLHITDNAGHVLDGLTMSATPWMVSHAHGTSVVPIVTPMGNGDYVVSELNLFMPGRWQIRVSVSAPMTDALTPVLDVP